MLSQHFCCLHDGKIYGSQLLTFTSLVKATQFIRKALDRLHSSHTIDKFSLQIWLPDCLDETEYYSYNDALTTLHDAVSSWLKVATSRKMKELSLDVYTEDYTDDVYFEMPDFLYGHPSFIKIFTYLLNYPLPKEGVCWGLLKELIIRGARFEDGALQKVLLGCPILECLELRWCLYSPPNIDTTFNIRLKRLLLKQKENYLSNYGSSFRSNIENLEISIPNVTSLDILGTWNRVGYQIYHPC